MTLDYVQRGETIDYVNSGAAKISAGTVVSLTTRIGVAAGDIEVGATGALIVEGVFTGDKATGAIALGAAVYYDATNGKLNTTDTDVPAGWCIKAAASGDAKVTVKIG